MSGPVACIHCGGLASHRAMPDGTDCPTARVIAMLRGGRRAVEAAQAERQRRQDEEEAADEASVLPAKGGEA